jgi:hypothetical protein
MRNKFGNKKTVIDGITFASKKEATRYQQLKLMVKAKAIKHLELQPRYAIEINGVKICTYVADFRYTSASGGKEIVEDVKGVRTPIYKLKKKLMKAIKMIEIQEI